MKTIYIINYWTSQYYEKDIWDKYYCSSLTSLKKKIKELLLKDMIHINEIKNILKPLDFYILDYKTCFSIWNPPNLEYNNWDLFIWIEEEILY